MGYSQVAHISLFQTIDQSDYPSVLVSYARGAKAGQNVKSNSLLQHKTGINELCEVLLPGIKLYSKE